MSSSTPRDVANLIKLPDAALLNIFARLPLEQILTLNQVSPRWRYLQAITLGRVQCLTVMSGPDAMTLVERSKFRFDHSEYVQLPGGSVQERDLLLGLRRVNKDRLLKFDVLSRDKLDLLIKTFTSVVKVQIVLTRERMATADCFGQLVTLLTRWRYQLQSLTLLVRFEYDPNISQFVDLKLSTPLIECFNKMSRLKHLFIEANHVFGSSILDLSILERLERFQFYTHDDPAGVLRSLKRYGQTNPKIRQVALGNYDKDFSEAFNLDAQLSSRVTVLLQNSLDMNYEERRGEGEDRRLLPKLQLLCHQFSALTYLDVDIVDYSTLELATALQSLKQLFYLKLNLLDIELRIDEDADHSLDHSAIPQTGPRLSSIQVLVLRTDDSYSHHDMAHVFDYAWTFPSVRVVHLSEVDGYLDCGPCRLSGHYTRTDEAVQFRTPHCIRQCMSAFKRCPQLVKAVYSRYHHYFTEFSSSDLNMAQ